MFKKTEKSRREGIKLERRGRIKENYNLLYFINKIKRSY